MCALMPTAQVGDWLKKCSAIYGEEMWDCEDVQRTRWAISNRTGKVKVGLTTQFMMHGFKQ